jgi:uncharacterized membrane protein (Fun14 family)
MGSNHTTLRIVAGIYVFVGTIATIVGTIAGFFVNIFLGIAILVLGIFATVSTTCLYYGVANVQQNQMNIATALERLNVKIEHEEKKYSKMFETPKDDK